MDSILTSVYSVLTLGIGILMTGLVMLRTGTARATALIGVLTGVLGIASVVETALTGSFAVLVVLASLLTIVWLVLVGWGLLRSRWAVNARTRRPGAPNVPVPEARSPMVALVGLGMQTPPEDRPSDPWRVG